jgi:hypothetical protein
MLAAIIPDDSSAATAARAHQLGDVMRLDLRLRLDVPKYAETLGPTRRLPTSYAHDTCGESKMSGLSRTANAPVNAVTSAVVVMIGVVSIRMMTVRCSDVVIPVMMLARNGWKRP